MGSEFSCLFLEMNTTLWMLKPFLCSWHYLFQCQATFISKLQAAAGTKSSRQPSGRIFVFKDWNIKRNKNLSQWLDKGINPGSETSQCWAMVNGGFIHLQWREKQRHVPHPHLLPTQARSIPGRDQATGTLKLGGDSWHAPHSRAQHCERTESSWGHAACSEALGFIASFLHK